MHGRDVVVFVVVLIQLRNIINVKQQHARNKSAPRFTCSYPATQPTHPAARPASARQRTTATDGHVYDGRLVNVCIYNKGAFGPWYMYIRTEDGELDGDPHWHVGLQCLVLGLTRKVGVIVLGGGGEPQT